MRLQQCFGTVYIPKEKKNWVDGEKMTAFALCDSLEWTFLSVCQHGWHAFLSEIIRNWSQTPEICSVFFCPDWLLFLPSVDCSIKLNSVVLQEATVALSLFAFSSQSRSSTCDWNKTNLERMECYTDVWNLLCYLTFDCFKSSHGCYGYLPETQ